MGAETAVTAITVCLLECHGLTHYKEGKGRKEAQP